MQQTSELYNEIFVSRDYRIENMLKVKVGSTYREITEDDLISINTSHRTFQNNKPEVGGCVCGEIDVEMFLPDFEIPQKAEITPCVRLVSNEMMKYADGNYLVNSTAPKTVTLTGTNAYTSYYYFNSDVVLTEGKTIVIEFDYSTSGITTTNAQIYSQINASIVSPSDSFIVGNVESGHHVATIRVTQAQADYASSNRYRVRLRYANEGASFTISNVRLYYPPSEWLKKGVYYIDTPQVTQNNDNLDVMTIHGYDSMIKTEQIYNGSTLEFPAKDIDIVNEIAQKLGVGVEAHTVELLANQYDIQVPVQYTYREILGFIGGMYVGNWVMNDEGDLQLISLYELPPESNILIDENGFWLVFGEGDNAVRILLKEE